MGISSRTVPREASSRIGERRAIDWQKDGEYADILYETGEGIAKITINRPEVRNAFRPLTITELQEAFQRAHQDYSVGVIIFTVA